VLITNFVTASNYVSRIPTAITPEILQTINNWVKQFDLIQNSGSTLFIAGNGGSASSSNHFSTDISIGGIRDGVKLSTRSLCESNSNITAILNDIGPAEIFSIQLEAFAKEGDAILLISASGNSQNLINCTDVANRLGLQSLGLTGFESNKLDKLVSSGISLNANTGEYGFVEDIHSGILHLLTYSYRLFKTDKKKYEKFLNLEHLSG
jgi:D-sedoheptulose 7-phosphate isomerase